MCAQSRPFYSLHTRLHSIHPSNTIVIFADYNTEVGLLSDNVETHYREQLHHLALWCLENNLVLNATKTKEVIMDFRKSEGTEHAPLLIQGVEVERVDFVKFLGIHITKDLTWALNTSHLVKKAQRRFSSSGK